jgi:zinc transporter, ZIP family
MMLAASTSLVYEGLVLESDHPCSVPQWARVLLGLLGGLLFITSTKKILDKHEDLKVAGLDGQLTNTYYIRLLI